jgi:hypothetical protein
MGITFADTFSEILNRVLFSCLSGAATRTYRRDQVVAWIRHRQQRQA